MKINLIRTTVITASITLLTLCVGFCAKETRQVTPRIFQPGKKFHLGFSQTLKSSQADVSLTFLRVVADSRCPAAAVCIRAGDVTILLKLTPLNPDKSAGEAKEFKMTFAPKKTGDVIETKVQGYTIRLLAVEPYPISDSNEIPEAKYRALLEVLNPAK